MSPRPVVAGFVRFAGALLRGIPGQDLARWLPRVGRRNKLPSRTVTFRLTPDDVRLLEALHHDLGISRTETVRRALRALAGETYFAESSPTRAS